MGGVRLSFRRYSGNAKKWSCNTKRQEGDSQRKEITPVRAKICRINKQNKTSGSLFQQKAKYKLVDDTATAATINYLETCLHYIHQNPVRAGFVKNLEQWRYSSFKEYNAITNDYKLKLPTLSYNI